MDKIIWKQIKKLNYINYYVSNNGMVKNPKGRIIKSYPNPKSHYLIIRLKED